MEDLGLEGTANDGPLQFGPTIEVPGDLSSGAFEPVFSIPGVFSGEDSLPTPVEDLPSGRQPAIVVRYEQEC